VGAERPVVVGHSMGGAIAIEMGTRPGAAGALVLVDPAPVAPPPELLDTVAGVIEGLKGPAYRDVAKEFLAAPFFFLESDDKEVRSFVVDVMTSAPQRVMWSCMEGIGAFAQRAADVHVDLPALDIPAGPVPLADPAVLAKVI